MKQIKEYIPRVKFDPLEQLEKAFDRWEPVEDIPVFQMEEVTVAQVRKLISELKNSLAFGHDGIDAVTLKSVAAILAQPVTHMINLSLGDDTLPS